VGSEFWLVQLEPDLAARYTTPTGVWCAIMAVNGVRSLTDLRILSLDTLTDFVRPGPGLAQALEAALGRTRARARARKRASD